MEIPMLRKSVSLVKGSALVLSAALSAAALAAAAPAATTSTAQKTSLLDKIQVNFAGTYYGPGLSNISAASPDATSLSGNGVQNLDSTLMAGYKLTDNIVAGPVLAFKLMPMGKEGVGDAGVGLKDPFLRAIHGKVYSKGNLNLSMDLRAYLPVTAGSQKATKQFGIRSSQNLSYEIPNTRLTLISSTFVRAWLYGSQMLDGSNSDLEIVFSPNLNYQFSPKVAATLWVDLLQLTHTMGDPTANLANSAIDIQPGVNWDVTQNFSLQPYLNFYPGVLDFEHSSVGLNISARLL